MENTKTAYNELIQTDRENEEGGDARVHRRNASVQHRQGCRNHHHRTPT